MPPYVVEDNLSPEFSARLQHLGENAQVEAIVIPRLREKRGTKRESFAGRKVAIEILSQGVQLMVKEIDSLLHQYSGRREGPMALGTINVVTTPEGIRAISRLPCVQAVLENQQITRLGNPPRSLKGRPSNR